MARRDRGMAGHRSTDDEGHLDAAVRPRPRPCVVFRSVGEVRRGHRGWLSDRRRGNPMITADPYIVVRAASIYVTALLTIAAWLWQRPKKGSGAIFRKSKNCTRPLFAGGLLAFAWNLPVLLLVNVVAQRFGWWQFDAQGGLLLGVPVDFLLAWVWLWSVVPLLAFDALAIGRIAIVALAFDLILMPAAAPVLRLGPMWLAGEVVALAAGLVPGLLVARMTIRDERL